MQGQEMETTQEEYEVLNGKVREIHIDHFIFNAEIPVYKI